MAKRQLTSWNGPTILVVLMVLLSISAAGTAGAAFSPADESAGVTASVASSGSATTTLVVDGDADGDDEYATIQAAINSATDGDTIEVASGTYSEELEIDRNITVVAPNGAALQDPNVEGVSIGIGISEDAAPTIAGLTITDYQFGVVADSSEGAWILRDIVIRNVSISAVDAERTEEAWTIENTTIYDSSGGIDADKSHGNWTVKDTTIGNNSGGIAASTTSGAWIIEDTTVRNGGIGAERSNGTWTVRDVIVSNGSTGIDASSSSGAWTISRATIQNHSQDGVETLRSTGPWTIRNSTIRHNSLYGIDAEQTTGPWSVLNTTVTGTTKFNVPDVPAQVGGTGIYAVNTSGAWVVHQSSITDNVANGINAEQSDPEGNATHNWWGTADGPSDSDCVGNVNCGNWLTSPPGEIVSGGGDEALAVDVSPGTATATELTDVTVTVTENATGDAVAGAVVSLSGVGINASGVTNSDGVVTFSNVTASTEGTIEVIVSAEGYANATASLTVEAAQDGDDGVAVVGSSPSTDGSGAYAGDGVHQNVNGDQSVTLADVTALFNNFNSATIQDNSSLFDFNGDGQISLADVTTLFNSVSS